MSVDIWRLREGDRRALARAITLVESRLANHRAQARQVLEDVHPFTGGGIRVGISGFPGVGKSTFIEAFGLHLIHQGLRVAVLAVDPSSPLRGGSILGDKTRMEELGRRDEAFIRPSPSGGALGGVAERTRESILLCEAAGYDVILVETVGVGQSEFAVADMVDFFLLLVTPHGGDDLQGIKRGIMEVVDGLVINKADGASLGPAEISQRHYRSALELMDQDGFWSPRVLTASAKEGRGLEKVWEMILEHRARAGEEGYLRKKRADQDVAWMNRIVFQELQARIRRNEDLQARAEALEGKVRAGEIPPFIAAHEIVELI